MSKKQIIVVIVITIIAVVGVLGGIAFSFRDTNVSVSNSILSPVISNEGTILDPQYVGYVEAVTDVYIYNSGILDIEDVVVHITAYFLPDVEPNSQYKVGEDTNDLGSLPAGVNSTKTISIRLTEQVARLAVFDGTIELHFDISLSLENIPQSLSFDKMTSSQYEAPFGV